jgi:hypothetical protein
MVLVQRHKHSRMSSILSAGRKLAPEHATGTKITLLVLDEHEG